MDLHFNPKSAVQSRRPSQPMQGQNMVRVFAISPMELVLQLRGKVSFCDAHLSPDEAEELADMLKQVAQERRDMARARVEGMPG